MQQHTTRKPIRSHAAHLVNRTLAVLEHIQALRSRQHAAHGINTDADQVGVRLPEALRQASEGPACAGAGDDRVDCAAGWARGGGGDGGEGGEDLDGGGVVVCVGVCAQQRQEVGKVGKGEKAKSAEPRQDSGDVQRDALAGLLYWSSMTAWGVVSTMRLARLMWDSGESHAASVGVR